ncbi:hypothetical protein HPP92_020317 [Vanilla planifolia]|uniref:Uncharacterized protein n=1 Tax=Vanilla planifolia TaxID=51239 RepID=A0A835Q3X5_VANPL|nr:hypothetical protein HPP92_020317 [Vanilla planifolia]
MVIFVDIICSSNSVILADKEIAFSFARGTTIDVAPVPIRFGLGSRAASTNLEFWVRRCIKTVMQPVVLGQSSSNLDTLQFKRLLHARRLDANFVPTVALWDVDSQSISNAHESNHRLRVKPYSALKVGIQCHITYLNDIFDSLLRPLSDPSDEAHDHASAVILSLVEEDIDVKFLKVRQVGTRLLGASICLLEVAAKCSLQDIEG